MKRGFTLIEMLVVIGIIAILIGAGMATFSTATRKAQQARAREVVSNVATALEAIYQKEGCFPRRVLKGGNDGEMDEHVAYELAKRDVMTLTYIKKSKENPDPPKRTVGADRFGVLTPWAQDFVKRNKDAGENKAVPSGGTIRDHRVHFAVDVNGDGIVMAHVGSDTLEIRASAVAWCCGRDGKCKEYSYSEGLRRGCSYSWSSQQVVGNRD